jgi:hypothetical protein
MRSSSIGTLAVGLLCASTLSIALAAQRRGGPPPPPSKPTPHHADGRVNLGPPLGETGIWTPIGIVQLSLNPKSVNRASPGSHLPDNITLEAVPFQPWARALHASRQANFESDEPHTRCKASGAARQFITPYGVDIVDMPETKRVYIFDVGGPHTFRTIYMDGRQHPKDLDPSYYGHSVGRWDGESLVVDTVGYNTKFWMDREGTPHTEQLHLIERFTRTDFNTLKFELTVDDPGAYTAVWTGGFLMRWQPATDPWEYICQDNNRSPQGMVGSEGSGSRNRKRIIP